MSAAAWLWALRRGARGLSTSPSHSVLIQPSEVVQLHSFILPSTLGLPFLKTIAARSSGGPLRKGASPSHCPPEFKRDIENAFKKHGMSAETLSKVECPRWLGAAVDEVYRFKASSLLPSRVLYGQDLSKEIDFWAQHFGANVPLDQAHFGLFQSTCAPFFMGNHTRPALVVLRNPDINSFEYLEYVTKKMAYTFDSQYLSLSPHDSPLRPRVNENNNSNNNNTDQGPRTPRMRRRAQRFSDDGSTIQVMMLPDEEETVEDEPAPTPRRPYGAPAVLHELLETAFESLAATPRGRGSVLFVRDVAGPRIPVLLSAALASRATKGPLVVVATDHSYTKLSREDPPLLFASTGHVRLSAPLPVTTDRSRLEVLEAMRRRAVLRANHELIASTMRDQNIFTESNSVASLASLEGIDDVRLTPAAAAAIVHLAEGATAQKVLERPRNLDAPPPPLGAAEMQHGINLLKPRMTIRADSGLTGYEKGLLSSMVGPSDTRVGMSDIGGLTDVKAKLHDLIILPLEYPHIFSQGILAQSVSGIMLFGPPGSGKTMLAKAVASESGASFLHVSAATILDKYFGEGEKRARAVFTLARKRAPCVVFIDEVDSLLQSRARNDSHGRDVLNELMSAWDGLLTGTDRVVVLAATNRPFDLDEAVLRRLPRRLFVDLPDAASRKSIMEVLTRNNTLAADVDLQEIASRTDGFSGSDLKNLCLAAAIAAARETIAAGETNKTVVLTRLHFDVALSQQKPSMAANAPLRKELSAWHTMYGEPTTAAAGLHSAPFGFHVADPRAVA
eukprot:m.156352 g.156352  ORF g.156352 m.156352 type:complete len:789 (-) comp15151_c1_seq8:41-2407(-)